MAKNPLMKFLKKENKETAKLDKSKNTKVKIPAKMKNKKMKGC